LGLGATITIDLNYEVKGLTFSVAVGYLMIAMIFTTVLLISDWEKLPDRTREKVAVEGDENYGSSSFSSLNIYTFGQNYLHLHRY
jgi:cell division septal protein FtsQ